MRPIAILMTLATGVLVHSAQADTRAAFLKMIDRPRVPLAPVMTKQTSAAAGIDQFHFTYAADAEQRVPGLLVRPSASQGRRPVVIVLHGTGGTKEGELPILKDLAAKGFIAIAIDGRYHGERSPSGNGSAAYQDAMLRTWRTGKEHPFLYDTVWDVMRLIDYIGTIPEADPARIGVIGFSKGGMETYLAAAVDPRIKVAVPCIGVQSFRWALDNDSWQSRAGTFQNALNTAAKDAGQAPGVEFLRTFYSKVAPGIYSDFDGPAMLPLIAPRPLLTINGEIDPRTPGPGLKECLDAAKKAYASAPDHLQSILEPKTGHKVNDDALAAGIAFLQRWL